VRAAIALVVVLASTPARGETVGVFVTGDDKLVEPVTSRVESYLRDHDRKVNEAPLSPDAVAAFGGCILLADDPCARSVIETRSNTNTTLVIVVETSGKDVVLTGRWFVKGNDPHVEHEVCNDCRRDAWHGIADRLMGTLVPVVAPPTGHLSVRSTPSGLGVVIDTTRVGNTPLEHDLVVGEHEVELRRGMRPVANRVVTIGEDATESLDITVPDERPPPPPPSRVGPLVAIGAGAVALGTGGYFLYYGLVGGRDDRQVYSYYEESPLIGGALATLGAVTLVTGIVL
jgi:hypothetical protein